MIKVITENRVPIKCWTNDIEVGAMKQANNLANLPFTFKHVALMPDCHEGYGMPIGGVLATKGVIVPNAVGVDIGCGMCAVKLENVTDIDKQTLMDIFYEIKNRVPVGFVHHIEKQPIECMPNLPIDNLKIVGQEFENARYQVGTLGGGNHFIEIQKEVTEGSDGNIWIMLHSGSRNLGKKVADYYNKIAQNLNATWFSEVKKETDLAFLPIQSNEGKAYFDEMKYCVDFGFCNRKLIMETIKNIITEKIPNVEFSDIINIAHNYARFENHFSHNVIVHRKGATSAMAGEIGIIPGSQGTKSFIVRGLGNPDSFMSCSHGSGRKMGRNAAKLNLKLADEIALMDNQNIIHCIKTIDDLDEAPDAYKDIDTVIKNESDLVSVISELKPLAVIKG